MAKIWNLEDGVADFPSSDSDAVGAEDMPCSSLWVLERVLLAAGAIVILFVTLASWFLIPKLFHWLRLLG